MTWFQDFAVMASSLISLVTTAMAFRFTRSMLEREKRTDKWWAEVALAERGSRLEAAEEALRAVRKAAGSDTKSSSR
ncbi:hypothetical protein [uncultured Zoogloea sp.]|uniref:hypothetical protein n=1 Tax=uncultured Zoogloea sp. TaxID=160237 RepID=UPI00262D619F|nr:hypothetical protein [uncultured Zoogloea sp.]